MTMTLGLHGVVKVVRDPPKLITDTTGAPYYRQRIHIYAKNGVTVSLALFSDDDKMWEEEGAYVKVEAGRI